MATVSFLGGTTRDLNNYLVGNGGGYTQEVTNYFSNQHNMFINGANYNPYQVGTQEYENIQAMYGRVTDVLNNSLQYTYNPNNVIGNSQQLLAETVVYDREFLNSIYSIKTLEDIQNANPLVQRFIMAHPTIAEAYDKGMVNGYSGTYVVNPMEKDVPYTERVDYLRTTDGIARPDENGEMFIETVIFNDSFGTNDNPFHLELSEQERIVEIQNQVMKYKLKGIDATKRD